MPRIKYRRQRPWPRTAQSGPSTGYGTELIAQPPGPPCLVIAEDDFFLRATPGALPGNAHIISTATLLMKIEELDPRFNARDILDAAKKLEGRDPKRVEVDAPAAKVKGGSSWAETLDASNLTTKPTRKTKASPRADQRAKLADQKA